MSEMQVDIPVPDRPLTKVQKRAKARLEDAIAKIGRNQAVYDAQAASGEYDIVFLNMRSTSLAMNRSTVRRLHEKYLASLESAPPARDVVGELKSLFASGEQFEYGFVNNGRTGPYPTVNGRGDAGHALKKMQYSAFRVGVKAFVQKRGDSSSRVYVDARMTRVAALRPEDVLPA